MNKFYRERFAFLMALDVLILAVEPCALAWGEVLTLKE